MTEEELLELISQIRNGRPEDDGLDWKRKFWDLAVPRSRNEFIKDIAAMANSQSPELVRLILLGVSETGELFDSPLPTDEANLQQTLSAITPQPSVRFHCLTIEQKRITVAEVRSPFDRPYVVRVDDIHIIPVRIGSSTRTATRFILDSFYQERRRKPSFTTEWWQWTEGQSGQALLNPVPLEGDLIIPPPICTLQDVLSRLEDRTSLARQAAEQADDAGYGERLHKFEAKRSRFLESIQEPHRLGRWYYWYELGGSLRMHDKALVKEAKEIRFFSLEISNSGNQPATGLRVKITFPNWILVFHEKPEREDLMIPATPSLREPPPRRKDYQPELVPNLGFEMQLRMLEAMKPPPTCGIEVSEPEHVVELWADQLDHQHSLGHSWRFGLLALPNKPPDVDRGEVSVELFFREADDWIKLTKSIQIEGG